MTDLEIINYEIAQYLNSDLYKIKCKALKYYKNDNDINNKKRYMYIDGVKHIAPNLENNIISHPIFRDLVDQKINYLLGNDWNVNNEDVAKIFDDNFRVIIERASTDAVMYGIGWLFVLPNGKFKYIDGLNVVPIWEDVTHTKLLKLIRFYTKSEYINKEKKEYTFAELWDSTGVKTYKRNTESEMFTPVSAEKHFKIIDYSNRVDFKNWEDPPFVFIKYNQDETPLIVLVKSLIDKMDKTASDTQDLLSDLTNKIGIITGATGTNPQEFAHNKRLYRLAILPEGATYTEVGTEPDISGAKAWIEHLRSQIYISGRGFDPLQAIGANASGDARRNLYTSLDLDVNQLEAGVLEGLKRCITFLEKSPITKINIDEDIKIKFNRNMLVNQGEQVDIALKVQQLEGASKELALSVSGITENPREEIEKAEEERNEEIKKQTDIFNQQDNESFKNNNK